MAKRQKTASGAKHDLVKMCSFIALVVAAFTFIFSGILSFLGSHIAWSQTAIGIINLIGKLALLIGIAFPAYDWTRGHKKWVRIVYWVALFVYVFGCVFGMIRPV